MSDAHPEKVQLGCGTRILLLAMIVTMAFAILYGKHEADILERRVDGFRTEVTALQQSVAELRTVSHTRPPSPEEELELWAKYASLTIQSSRAAERRGREVLSQDFDGFLRTASEQFGLSKEDLDQLLERGNRLGWSSSPKCSPPLSSRWRSLIARPVLREPLSPRYPPGARSRKIEGMVILEAAINHDGTVDKVTVLKGAPELTESAIASVAASHWFPALLCGRPIDLYEVVTVPFVLQSYL